MGHLINLLAATHSFLSGRMPAGRFQMRDEFLLPKFNHDRPDPLPSPTATVSSGVLTQTTIAPVATKTQSGLKSTSNLLRLFGGRPLQSPGEKNSRLDGVRVVRNDLLDSDIEVAPQGESRSARQTRPRLSSEDVSEQFTKAGKRLLEKIGI
jgi:hypothetical protein